MKNIVVFLTFFLLLLLPTTPGWTQIRLPNLITDGMVLQRDSRLTIWGWASPGEKITVSFDGKRRKTSASSGGEWRIELPAMKAGGPYTMDISGKNHVKVKDIMIGDVWLCAGQSNMVHQLDIHDVTYAQDITDANYPAIRHFKVPTFAALGGTVEDLAGGQWVSAVGENVRPFSAVAYFFARKLYDKYHIPIGLINASVGGTPIEAWISEDGFKQFPEILKEIGQNKDTAYVNGMNRRGRTARMRPQSNDKGSTGPKPWYATDYVPRNWRVINIPGYWEDQGVKDMNGIVWYRREVTIPESMVGKDARLFMGRIVDADKVYINGTEVGSTTYQYPQRRYKIPSGVLKAGRNLFVVRVTNFNGRGGFVPDKPYYLFTDGDTIDLKGYWRYKVGEVFEPRPPASTGINAQNEPTSLYNGMVAPYVKYPVKGVLWYQGESNAGRPQAYAALLQTLIQDWRQNFSNQNMPFIYAQLPNFMEVSYLPGESNWALLRESQLKALELPGTAMTVNIDLGEWNDIHPDNKKDVGERMALAALKVAYSEDVVHSGPVYRNHTTEGNRVTLFFSHVGGGLMTSDGEAPSEFAIAGPDKSFVWADARLEGNKVIVWSDEIADPRFVRYAWADNPDNPNLYNKEGLPASPFQVEIGN